MNITDAPTSWIQAGVVVLSLCFGAFGSYFNIDYRLSRQEDETKKIVTTIDKLSEVIVRLDINTAVLNAKLDEEKKRKG